MEKILDFSQSNLKDDLFCDLNLEKLSFEKLSIEDAFELLPYNLDDLLSKEEALKFTTFREQIFASTFVFGFLPNLSFLLITLNVPKDEIFILLEFVSSDIKDSKKLSIIEEVKFLEKPIF